MHVSFEELGLHPRFWVQRTLGEGARSRVYEVWDAMNDVRRALKLASGKSRVPAARREYRLLSELRHPHIVRAYDFGLSAHGVPYTTLELVHGVTFGRPVHGGEPELVAVAAAQILDALATLHARGYVHRDLNPHNLLVVGRGPGLLVRVIDFGLATPVGRAAHPAGTLPYVAPEVTRGEPFDGRADLYSLGVLLYEALVEPEASHSVEAFARQLAELPPSPVRVNPVVPRDLSDFVMKLLAPVAADRFEHATAAIEALTRIGMSTLGRGPRRAAAERLLRGGAVSHRPGARNIIRRRAARVRDEGRGAVLVLEGATGVGKTPFLRELGANLCLDGFRVAHVRTGAEAGAPIGRLLRAAQGLDPEAVSSVTPAWLPWDAPNTSPDPAANADNLARCLAVALGREPTVLLIDDLHKAEPAALELLRQLGVEVLEQPVLLVCTADPREDRLGLADLFGSDREVHALAPLTPAEVSKLAAHRLHGLTIPRPALLRLTADAQGMPSLVERTLARLLVEGTIERRQSAYVFAGGRYLAAQHGEPEQASERLARVRSELLPVLRAAAVLGARVQAPSVAALVGQDVDAVAQSLAELARDEILSAAEASASPAYLFSRRLLAQAAYQQIPADERRELHDRAAALLSRDPRNDPYGDEIVEHVLRGSDDTRAVQVAMEAGDRAARQFADKRAVELYSRAHARVDRGHLRLRAELALRLGKVLERTGELERAGAWYEAALADAGGENPTARVEASLGLAAVALVRGLPDETERHAAHGLELVAMTGSPLLEARALRLTALVAIQRGDDGTAQRLLGEALRFVGSLPDQGPAIEVLLDLARLAQRRGELVAAVRRARQALHRARVINDPSSVALASCVLARGLARAGRVWSSRRVLLAALRGVRSSGDRLREAMVLRELAHLRLREGELHAALERYEQSLALARTSRARGLAGALLIDVAFIRAMVGDFRGALAGLGAALDTADSSGDVRASQLALLRLAQLRARIGDYARASELVASAGSGEVGEREDPVLRAERTAVAAWLAALRGELEPAAAMAAELTALVAPLEDPVDRGLVLLLEARVALLTGRLEQAGKACVELGSLVEGAALGYLAPQLALLRGQVLAQQGLPGPALEPLRQAVERAAILGAVPVEIEARATLGGVLAGTDPGAEELTRAMELLRELTAGLPRDAAATLLATRAFRDLRAAFTEERRRLGFRASPGPQSSGLV